MKKIILIILVAALVAAPAFAEVYRWTGDDGIEHLTNDPEKVPPQYLPQGPVKPARRPAKTQEPPQPQPQPQPQTDAGVLGEVMAFCGRIARARLRKLEPDELRRMLDDADTLQSGIDASEAAYDKKAEAAEALSRCREKVDDELARRGGDESEDAARSAFKGMLDDWYAKKWESIYYGYGSGASRDAYTKEAFAEKMDSARLELVCCHDETLVRAARKGASRDTFTVSAKLNFKDRRGPGRAGFKSKTFDVRLEKGQWKVSLSELFAD